MTQMGFDLLRKQIAVFKAQARIMGLPLSNEQFISAHMFYAAWVAIEDEKMDIDTFTRFARTHYEGLSAMLRIQLQHK